MKNHTKYSKQSAIEMVCNARGHIESFTANALTYEVKVVLRKASLALFGPPTFIREYLSNPWQGGMIQSKRP